jgi:hypothetical protein
MPRLTATQAMKANLSFQSTLCSIHACTGSAGHSSQ